jgi:outer membrane lipoprotein-sorting protein
VSRVTTCLLAFTLALGAAARAVSPPTSRPAGIDDATWQRMLAIDAKAGQIQDLVADFEQKKFTAMLKKPLVSSGQVLVRGSRMLWESRAPEPGALQIDDREARIYYPAEKAIEVYAVEARLSQLAASPVPRLDVLTRHFTFKPLAAAEMGEKATTEDTFAVEMTPIDAAMRGHIDRVRVLLDAARGLIVRLEMTDADGDRTLIAFSNVRTNVGVSDEQLTIDAPGDVKVTRPLAAVEGERKDAR